ncbi:MAG: RNA 2'-phosphotransferase [Saprospiraceae bacterium]|nr:RNA 2'-phosphotransferase [Saprospiraceae bacterium]MCF8248891.1 RNA 2'-phosphotransferase [Saprospiraceae bacterium]MCF8279616.1 RNA 2'-phosphotransferase [Bacteroidales bacterium]MCF8310176.1 RNA 2'-phosphotransferase [Saprospiraceae bacterium]MCF8439076.1 RNA 2'-phosphotransferase [Saprospiraceae bacterium]
MQDLVKSSKFLSFVLRHRPDKIGLKLEENGWAVTTELLEKLNSNNFPCDFEKLKSIVENDNKQRYAFSEDFLKIRASQGHSIKVDLGLLPKVPPGTLFHGTAGYNIPSIKKQGLLKAKRHHVHLSINEETAIQVGGRHGKPVVLRVKAIEMTRIGHVFYQSENGVWLTDTVPPEFLVFPS